MIRRLSSSECTMSMHNNNCAMQPSSAGARILKPNSFDFLKSYVVGRPVVELGRSRRLARRDVGCRFEGAAILQVDGDDGGAEAVVEDAAFEARGFCAALDDAERVDPGHAFVGELTGAAAGGAK